MYTDETGRFPVHSQIFDQYIMIAYHCDSITIIDSPFKSHANKHILLDYGSIMQHLKDRNILGDLQILDNEASTEYKRIIKYEWVVGYQFAPPHFHGRNAAERAILIFKSHFLFILAGIENTFHKNVWDLVLPQIELTFNLLRQSTPNPNILAWEYFQGPFDYKTTPLGPLGCPVMILQNKYNCKSWKFRGKEGWIISVDLDHY